MSRTPLKDLVPMCFKCGRAVGGLRNVRRCERCEKEKR